ncbi:hypothetical protein [Neorhodopirellula lusitana]|uniref:hypothetical protein n=1 Tax=Neorhodopirellula lusitana TaxID=445327 RepID=UPI00384E10E3
MLREAREPSSSIAIPEKLNEGLEALQEAFKYAHDVGSEPWEFAVSMLRLEQLGFNPSDIRWLTLKGLAEHAREVTVQGDDGRQFRPTGNLSFCEQTCVVLTEAGAAILDRTTATIAAPAQCYHPDWDGDARRLCFNGTLVKVFKWRAANQEVVLAAFQEEGWPSRIDDPLSPSPELDSKRRLSDTIKCLNRKQVNSIIHFRGDGTGEGIVWEHGTETLFTRLKADAQS